MRISLSDELYWLLAAKAASCHMKPIPFLEKWLREELAVCQDAKAEGLPHDSSKPRKGTFSDEEIDQIKTLSLEGWSPGRIAKELHRHKSSVAYAVDAMKKRGEL